MKKIVMTFDVGGSALKEDRFWYYVQYYGHILGIRILIKVTVNYYQILLWNTTCNKCFYVGN
jgi:hypothetical protein